MRWDEPGYFLGKEFDNFWAYYINNMKGNTLFILGKGFDPRMCMGVEALYDLGMKPECCLLVDLNEEPNARYQYPELVEENFKRLTALLEASTIKDLEVRIWSNDLRRVGSRNVINKMNNFDFGRFSNIILDISAIPRCIFIVMLNQLIKICDKFKTIGKIINLHLIVSENPNIDILIQQEGLDEDAYLLPGFSGRLQVERMHKVPKIWMPILGENKLIAIRRIYEYLRNFDEIDEICPILPFPATNPRRSDDIISEYHSFLFEETSIIIEPKNFIFASEKNPFDIYRQIFSTTKRYNSSLSPLGGCVSIISALSSKIMTVGASLAAYDLTSQNFNVAIAQIDSLKYTIKEPQEKMSEEAKNSTLHSIWICGDYYE